MQSISNTVYPIFYFEYTDVQSGDRIDSPIKLGVRLQVNLIMWLLTTIINAVHDLNASRRGGIMLGCKRS